MGYIYILTSPNGKSYIGQTTRSIEKRFEKHQQSDSRCVAIYNAIQKYGWESIEKDWYECPDEDLNFDEELLVREMETLSPNGYNLREGGGSNGKLSEETKHKIGEGNRGKTVSEETKQRMRKPKSEEHKKRMREARLGKEHSEETKQKLREINLGKTISDETKQKQREALQGEKHPNSKRVYQYDINGVFIDSFGSAEEAGRVLKKAGAHISACARGIKNGRHKTAYGFKWSYSEPILTRGLI